MSIVAPAERDRLFGGPKSLETMRCPVDRTELTPQAIGAANFLICPACRGMWFSAAALAEVPRAVEHLPFGALTVPGGASTSVDPQRRIPCRTCMEPLRPRLLGRATIDVCGRCGGVWLDAGELPLVADWYRAWYLERRDGELLPGADPRASPLPAMRDTAPADNSDVDFVDLAFRALALVARLGVAMLDVGSPGTHHGGGSTFGGGGGFGGGAARAAGERR